MPSEPEDLKDYISMRWDVTEKGRLVVYQFPDDDEDSPPHANPIAGGIRNAEYAKVTMVVENQDDQSHAKKKQSQVFSEDRHVKKKSTKNNIVPCGFLALVQYDFLLIFLEKIFY